MSEDQNKKSIRREIVLISKQEPNSTPSFFDKAERFAKIISLIGIPIVVAFTGWIIQQQLAEKNVNKDYVGIAVSILSDPKTTEDKALRSWAVDLLNATSPTKFPKETATSLKTGAVSLPRGTLPDAEAYSAIARSFETTGDYDKALESYEQALKLKIRTLGSDHPDVANSYNNLGGLFYSMGDYSKAQTLFEKALEIRLKVLGETNPDTAISYANLGNLLASSGQFGKAEAYYLKALEIQKRTLGQKSPILKNTLVKLMELYNLIGNTEKSATIRSELNALLRTE